MIKQKVKYIVYKRAGALFFIFLLSLMGYITKYQRIKHKETERIKRLSHKGMPVCLVTKPSKNAAIRKTGTKPITILIPSLPAAVKDCVLVNVFGNNIELPSTIPAQPAITIAEISSVPCINTTRIEAAPKL